MEAKRFSETSVHTRSTLRYISEDGILHSHRRENLKSFKEVNLFLNGPWNENINMQLGMWKKLFELSQEESDESGFQYNMKILELWNTK
jgi:hypothetical protein